MAKKKEYAKWKLVTWRFVRVFLAVFLTTIAFTIKDLQNIDNLWAVVLFPALVAGASALFKALREYYGEGDYGKAIYKLPL